MIDILPQIAHNYIAQAAFWGWFTAQAIKFCMATSSAW